MSIFHPRLDEFHEKQVSAMSVDDALSLLEGESQRVHDMLNCGTALSLFPRPTGAAVDLPPAESQLPMNNLLLQEVQASARSFRKLTLSVLFSSRAPVPSSLR